MIGREQVTFGAVVFGSVFCMAVWVFVQDLGFLGGVGTDPNSMIPTVLLLTAGYLALTRGIRHRQPLQNRRCRSRREPTVTARTTRRLRPLTSPAGLGLIAVVATFGIVLVGAVPMAFASVNTHTDTIVTEAINGQPEPTDTPAAPFELTDQHGTPVSLATFKGRTVAMTFLDPVCTTDCPLIAQQFRQVDERLGSTANTAFVAVVANPTYLDVQFVQAFDAQENMDMPNWYFLTGSLAQLRAVWNAYGIEVQTIGSGGMAAHSETAYVIDGAGHLRTILGSDPGTRDRLGIVRDTVEQRNARGRSRMRSPQGANHGERIRGRRGVGHRSHGRRCAGGRFDRLRLALSRPRSDPATAPIDIPLATSVVTPSGTWAMFPMGHLDDPTNTFWEVFALPSGADQWAERTPPDVADNGGLVTAPTSTGVVVGFRPSDL